MRLPRIAAIGGASLIALARAGSTAFADATVTPDSGLQDGDVVAVNISGLTTFSIAYVTQCGKSGADPTFDFAFDCNNPVGRNPTLVNGAGTTQLTVFKGPDPVFGTYTCDENNPCWIRVSPGQEDNTAADEFYPITFAAGTGTTTTIAATTTTIDPGTEIDEAPVNILLPLTAAGIAGGAFFVTRRRRVGV